MPCLSDEHSYPSSNWPRYYEATKNSSPRETLVQALQRFDRAPSTRPRFAVDLGCGGGADTRELLAHGWRVLAIDNEPAAIERVRSTAAQHRRRLQTRIAAFDAAWWPTTDLLNASFALPFCPPEAFPNLWTRIEDSIRAGGRFAGHFFGEGDDWATDPQLTIHTRADVLRLLSRFEIELLREQDNEAPTALGAVKHWHVFHVVARKLAQ